MIEVPMCVPPDEIPGKHDWQPRCLQHRWLSKRKPPGDAQSALEQKLFRCVGRTGEVCFVWHGLGSSSASPLMACFACENFSAFISLWDGARISFAGGFQSVAIMSRIARACLATMDRLRFSNRLSVRRAIDCDSAFRSMVKLFRARHVT